MQRNTHYGMLNVAPLLFGNTSQHSALEATASVGLSDERLDTFETSILPRTRTERESMQADCRWSSLPSIPTSSEKLKPWT